MMQPGMVQPGMANPSMASMPVSHNQQNLPLSAEGVAAVESLKCISITLLIFCILGFGNLMVSIPGIIAASQFLCDANPNSPKEKLRNNLECLKCVGTATMVLAIISCLGCLGGAFSILSSPCVIIWWTPTWGCYYYLAYFWLGHAFGCLTPIIICTSMMNCRATTLAQALAAPSVQV